MIEFKKLAQPTSSVTSWMSALSLGFLLALSGCTGGGNQSKISIQLPSASKVVGANSVSTSTSLTHLRIQIYPAVGTDAAQVFSWDQSDSSSAPGPAQFSVPTDTQLVIQVLAAYQDPTVSDSNVYFAYGDSTQAVSAAGDVSVSLTTINSTSSQNGVIAGRFIRAGGLTGPTGRVRIEYPVAGKRPILIVTQEIFGGWFKFFSAQGVPLNYTMNGTNEVLFTNASVDAASMLAVDDATTNSFDESTRTALVSMPSYYQPSGNPYSQKAGQSLLFGFFGPGAGTNMACYPAAGANLVQTATAADPNLSANLTWNGSSTLSATQAGVTSGGKNSTGSSVCTSTTGLFNDHVVLNASYLASREQSLGYNGPFQLLGSNGGSALQISSYVVTGGNATAVVNWQMLPNVISATGNPGGLDGVAIFKRDGTAVSSSGKADYQIDDGYACGNLEAKGFTKVISQPLVSGVLPGSVTISAINALNFQSGKFQVVACPYRTILGVTTYMNSAAEFRSSSNASGVNYKLGLASGSSDSIAKNTCVGYKVYSFDNNGNQVVATASTTLSLISSLAGGFVYTDSNCTSLTAATSSNSGFIGGTVTQAAGSESSTTFYVNFSAPQAFSVAIANGAATSYSTINVYGNDPAATYGFSLNNNSTSNLTFNTCYPLYFGLAPGGATDLSVPAVRSADQTFSISSPGGLFFSDARCQNTLAQFTISAGSSGKQLYFIPLTSSSLGFAVSRVTTDNPSINAANSVSGSLSANTPAGYSASLSNSSASASGAYAAGECKAILIRPVSASAASVYAQVYSVLSLSLSGGTLYSDSACTTSTNHLVFLIGSGSLNVYMKAASGSNSVTLSGSDGASLMLPTTSIPIDAPKGMTLKYLGQSLTSVMTNSCYAIVASMLDSSGSSYASPTAYSLTASGISGTGVYLFSDSQCLSVSSTIPVAATSSTANFYAKFTSPPGGVAVGGLTLASTRAPGLAVNYATSVKVIDTDHVGVTYQSNGAGSGAGTLSFQMYDQNGSIVNSGIVSTALSFALGGNFRASGGSSTTGVVSLSAFGSGSTSISGGTANSSAQVGTASSSLWQGTVTPSSTTLAY